MSNLKPFKELFGTSLERHRIRPIPEHLYDNDDDLEEEEENDDIDIDF